MKNLLFTAILVLNSLEIFAQKTDMTIHIKFDGGLGMTHYVDIIKTSQQVIISSPRFIKLRGEELHKDTGFLNLRKNKTKHPGTELTTKLQGFYDQYSIFDTTTVTINLKEDRKYDALLKVLAVTSKAKLEKSHEIKDIVMDAGDATFTITTNNNIKKVYAEGLFEQRYPILTNFVAQTYARLEPLKQK
jgi:hypothetical protein